MTTLLRTGVGWTFEGSGETLSFSRRPTGDLSVVLAHLLLRSIHVSLRNAGVTWTSGDTELQTSQGLLFGKV